MSYDIMNISSSPMSDGPFQKKKAAFEKNISEKYLEIFYSAIFLFLVNFL